MRLQVARCAHTQTAARVGNGMRTSTRWLGRARQIIENGLMPLRLHRSRRGWKSTMNRLTNFPCLAGYFSEVVAQVGNCDGAWANVAAHGSDHLALKKILSWRDPDGIKEIAPFIRVTTMEDAVPRSDPNTLAMHRNFM